MYAQRDIDELIAKKLADALPPDEAAQLDAWLAESAENRRYFEQTVQLWQAAPQGRAALSRPVDTEAALRRVKARLQPAAAPARRVAMPFWAAAAAAMLAAAVVAWYFFQPDGDPGASVALQAAASPRTDTLRDGSVVSLNRQSALKTTFSGKKRRVELQGEAFFRVAPNARAPFVVAVQALEIEVLGTAFNVDAQSQPDLVRVSVQEGRLLLRSTAQEMYLSAGESADYDAKTQKIRRGDQGGNSNAGAWRDRRLRFDGTPLGTALPQLEKAYGVRFALKNKDLANCRWQTQLDALPLDEVLELLRVTFSLRITQESGQYLLDGSGCE
jgi:ferric-dicitrate binding protein FerR (iron transport regulator)